MKMIKTIVFAAVVLLLLAGCAGKSGQEVQYPVSNVSHPDWTASAVLYEVNVRQYTKEGTFKALTRGGHPLVHARVSHRRGGAQG